MMMAHRVLLAFAYLSSSRPYEHTPSPTLPGTLLHFPSIMPPPDVYRDQLLALGNGYALYEPDPSRELHVRVGDVGHVDPSTGHFHRLFNAFCDHGSPINTPHGVPEHFEPLSKKLRTVFNRTALSVGTYSSRDVSTLQGEVTMQG